MHSIEPLYVLSGFAVGALVGMTGVGGGSLMTPLLILMFGVHPATAVGTDLLYAATTKTCGTAVHGINRTVDWRVVGRLAAGSVPMTVVTLLMLALLRLDPAAVSRTLTTALAVALVPTAISLVFRTQIIARYGAPIARLTPSTRALLTVAMGAILGVLVPLSSVGAGALGVTALVLLYPELSAATIVGSDIAHAVPLTLVAGFGHWLFGSINWHLLGSLVIGSLPGIVIGSRASLRVPDTVLRPILAITLLIVASQLLMHSHAG
jgi:uncharacterized protein